MCIIDRWSGKTWRRFDICPSIALYTSFIIDGMAFWYTASGTPPRIFSDTRQTWEGLAVVFDTYDNDGRGFDLNYVSLYGFFR